MDLNTLQIALLDDNRQAVRSLIDEIDRKTENEAFRLAGEHFGFPTLEWSGMRLGYQGDLASVLGYSDPSGLRKLAERYELEAFEMAWFGQNVRTILRESFNLNEKTSRAIFFKWSAFLVGGMASTNDAADKVKRYLLESERAARIGSGMIEIAKARQIKLAETDKVISMAAKADRIRDENLRLSVLQHLDEALGGVLKVPKQADLFKAN